MIFVDKHPNFTSIQVLLTATIFRIYLGATTREFPNNYKYKYDIESVRQPEATIEMYKRGAYFTSQSETGNDIALIKLKTKVVFIPMKISPVWLLSNR